MARAAADLHVNQRSLASLKKLAPHRESEHIARTNGPGACITAYCRRQ